MRAAPAAPRLMANPTFSMLVPLPYEDSWTVLDEFVFNARPLEQFDLRANIAAVTASTVPITAATSATLALLAGNPRRRLLIVQNSSKAPTTGDTAPTFWVAFGRPAIIGQDIALVPNGGTLLCDFACPIDAVYVAIGPSVNPGSSVVVQGAASQGLIPPVGGGVWGR